MSLKPPSPDNLTKINQKDLDEIIDKHTRFTQGQRGGARASLKFMDLSGLDFKQCDLSHADFTGSLLRRADLSGGIFRSSCFFACDLHNANLEQAKFERADFRGAYVAGANLSGADLDSADLREGKIMQNDGDGGLQNSKDRQSFNAVFSLSLIHI